MARDGRLRTRNGRLITTGGRLAGDCAPPSSPPRQCFPPPNTPAYRRWAASNYPILSEFAQSLPAAYQVTVTTSIRLPAAPSDEELTSRIRVGGGRPDFTRLPGTTGVGDVGTWIITQYWDGQYDDTKTWSVPLDLGTYATSSSVNATYLLQPELPDWRCAYAIVYDGNRRSQELFDLLAGPDPLSGLRRVPLFANIIINIQIQVQCLSGTSEQIQLCDGSTPGAGIVSNFYVDVASAVLPNGIQFVGTTAVGCGAYGPEIDFGARWQAGEPTTASTYDDRWPFNSTSPVSITSIVGSVSR